MSSWPLRAAMWSGVHENFSSPAMPINQPPFFFRGKVSLHPVKVVVSTSSWLSDSLASSKVCSCGNAFPGCWPALGNPFTVEACACSEKTFNSSKPSFVTGPTKDANVILDARIQDRCHNVAYPAATRAGQGRQVPFIVYESRHAAERLHGEAGDGRHRSDRVGVSKLACQRRFQRSKGYEVTLHRLAHHGSRCIKRSTRFIVALVVKNSKAPVSKARRLAG